MNRDAKRILVVEDDPQLQHLLMRLASGWGYDCAYASSVEAATEALANLPDLVLLDVHLDDGTAVRLAERMARMSPSPEVIVISGAATPAEAFELAQCGVRKYIAKPFTGEQLRAAVGEVLSSPAAIEPHVRHSVPGLEMRELVTSVRETAIDQAISLADGNSAAAARMLGISRQAVQQILRKRARSGD